MKLRYMTRNILIQYLQWHFLDAPKSILMAWRNYLKFNLNYWSILVLLKTLFSHWRRYYYSYGKRFDLGRYFEALTFNLMSRIIGAILRIFFIALGLLIEVVIIFVGILLLAGWLFLPLIILFLLFGIIFGLKIF